MNESTSLLSPWQLLRDISSWLPDRDQRRADKLIDFHEQQHRRAERREETCRVYTSEAADDPPWVDLGGRRILKKTK